MRKIYVTICILSFFAFPSLSLTLKELISLQSQGVEFSNDFFTARDWSLTRAESKNDIKKVEWEYARYESWIRTVKSTVQMSVFFENGNLLCYDFKNDKIFNQLKDDLKKNGYKKTGMSIGTDSIRIYDNYYLNVVDGETGVKITSALVYTYDNNVYSITMWKIVYDVSTSYFVSVWNHKKADDYINGMKDEKRKKEEFILQEERRNEELRIQREAKMKLCYDSLVRKADSLLSLRQNESAIYHYKEASVIYPHIKYPQSMIEKASYRDSISKKRMWVVYNYCEMNNNDCAQIERIVKIKIFDALQKSSPLQSDHLFVDYVVDSTGKVSLKVDSYSILNDSIMELLHRSLRSVPLEKQNIATYPVNSKLSFSYPIKVEEFVFDVKRKTDKIIVEESAGSIRYAQKIETEMKNYPKGKYLLKIRKVRVGNDAKEYVTVTSK